MLRIIRAILIVLTTVTVAIAVGVCTVAYRLSNGAAEETIARVSQEAFGARAQIDGTVSVKKFPRVIVQIPAVRFFDDQTGRQIGSIESAKLHLSLWALPLGAVRVTEGVVTGLKGEVRLSELSLKSLFDNSLRAMTFPRHVRLGNMRFEQGDVTLRIRDEAYRLHNLSAGFDGLSPEMTSSVAWSADVEKLAAALPAQDAPQTPGASQPGSDAAQPGIRWPDWLHAFDGFAKGLVNGSGKMTLSVESNFVAFENAQASLQAETADGKVLAAARALRFSIHEGVIAAQQAAVTIGRPDRSPSDIRFDIEDLRYENGLIQSPNARVQLTDKAGSRTAVLNIAARVKADVPARQAELSQFEGTVAVTGDPALPADFAANLKGVVNVDGDKAATVSLKGRLAGSPIAFEGTLTALSDQPTLRGKLSVGKLDLAALPRPRSTDWMRLFAFDGTMDLANLSYGTFAARSLKGGVKLKDGVLAVEDCVLESAAGVARVSGSIDAQAKWSASGRADALDVSEMAGFVGVKTPLLGAIAGTFEASGTGRTVRASGQAKLSQGVYRALDALGVRKAVITGIDWIPGSDDVTLVQNASCNWTLADGVLKIADFSANSVDMRAEGAFSVTTAAGTLQGDLHLHFPALSDGPALSVDGRVSGTVEAPVWQFEYSAPRAEFQKFQQLAPKTAKPEAPADDVEPAEPGVADFVQDKAKEAWDSVKKLF